MGPLEGLKILEFAGIGPGPFCGMMLADMGAEVLRIERPVGVGNKSHDVNIYNMGKFDIMNRNRRVLRLNIKLPEAQSVIHKLIREADGLFEGFRPGVMEKLGLGPSVCLGINPRIVYGRMTGWGQEGPLSSLAGHDANYIGLNGVLDLIGNKGEKPVSPPALVGDMGGGGMFLAYGMLAGIIHASRTGEGQVVDAAIVAGSALLSAIIWSFRGLGLWGQRGNNILDGGAHFYGTYECSDGKYISVGAIEPQFYQIVLDKLGLAGDMDFAAQVNPAQWPHQKEKLTILFKTNTQNHWAGLFEGTDACVWPILSGDEALEHPQIKARKTFIEKDDVIQPAPSPHFSRTPGGVKHMAGGLEEKMEDILKSWGLSETEYSDLHNASHRE